jgi:hypothetical protein
MMNPEAMMSAGRNPIDFSPLHFLEEAAHKDILDPTRQYSNHHSLHMKMYSLCARF